MADLKSRLGPRGQEAGGHAALGFKDSPKFKDMHPGLWAMILLGGGLVAGLVGGQSCKGISSRMLNSYREQLEACQAFQGYVRSQLTDLVGRYVGPEGVSPVHNADGGFDEEATVTQQFNLLKQALRAPRVPNASTSVSDGGLNAGVSYSAADAGTSAAKTECPVPALQSCLPCPPRLPCSASTTGTTSDTVAYDLLVEKERSRGLDERLRACLGDKEVAESLSIPLVSTAGVPQSEYDACVRDRDECRNQQSSSYDRGFVEGKESVHCPVSAPSDCSAEYRRGLADGKEKGRQTASAEETARRRACAGLKSASTPDAMRTVLHDYVHSTKRAIQVPVNDPELATPEAAQGIVREYCGADDVQDTELVGRVDSLLTLVYGREAMYPAKIEIGRPVCYTTTGRVVRIGTEFLLR